ncbi:MAG TPA: hypothetical protein VFE24_01860 [Pirellulales bacterium]|jgi:pimeloyl-ACP methyl ester carboxylesterase|nr:hypothetical protein [Pirellulales bacterium]
MSRANRIWICCFFAIAGRLSAASVAAADYVPFAGKESVWHEGYQRFDFVMDEKTLAISPWKGTADEHFGVKDPDPGERRCIVVVPKEAAPGRPWSWRGCYWDHQPQTEIALLKRGFHIAYISANANLRPSKHWDAWYQYLTAEHGLSPKPAFIGMSRGGEFAYTWSVANPDKVSCIYADNPGINPDVLSKLGGLAKADVPLLQVCGSIDPLLGRSASAIEAIYQQYGGRVSMMIKEGAGHHPHSLRDPHPIVEFIDQSVKEKSPSPPDYVPARSMATAFYSTENQYRDFPQEGLRITCRGPVFSGSYERYALDLRGVEGTTFVIEPKKAAAGNPWVLRAEFVDRSAAVDLALLAKGFRIVTGPVPYNADGPSLASWNAVYTHLVDKGFSAKPVLQGSGAAASDAYAWAESNPTQVACMYAENPWFRTSTMAKGAVLERLDPLAKAQVPVLHVCGSLDPAYQDQARAFEKRYQELGGKVQVIVQEGVGHYPTAPHNLQPVVDFILAQQPR